MGAGHSHGGTAGGRHKRPLLIAFSITAGYMFVEAIAGLVFGSLALLSDAGHMLTDVVGLGMALAAIQFAQGGRSASRTYGLLRLEVLAALLNAVLLFAVAGYVLYEASRRFGEPTDVAGVPLLAIAAVGLGINVVSYRLLKAGAEESINVRGAFLEVVADMLGSVGVLVGGLIIIITGWSYVDPIVGVGIGLFILPRAYRLGRDALGILLEIAPRGTDVAAIEAALGAVPGVTAVHDLHVWTLTSGTDAATGHLVLDDVADLATVLGDATRLLEERFGITHATLQCEPSTFQEEPREI